VPELFVLVTGPARGYVRRGLERLAIPHRHCLLPDIDVLVQAYDAIDVCLVTSRDEGGPRAVLEAMATGVPLVSTRVGQGADLVQPGRNGWLAEVEDVEALVDATSRVARLADPELESVRAEGRATAEANSYRALEPRWLELLRGFVEIAPDRP
jgi:glycosyltransferase involved in cell wall biosynthesis